MTKPPRRKPKLKYAALRYVVEQLQDMMTYSRCDISLGDGFYLRDKMMSIHLMKDMQFGMAATVKQFPTLYAALKFLDSAAGRNLLKGRAR